MTEKNQAQSLLEKLTAGTKGTATVDVAGVEFVFHRDDMAYDAMLNEIESNNKLTPMKDYLLTIVDRSQREQLLEVINVPNLAPKIVAEVNQVFIPEIEVKLKN